MQFRGTFVDMDDVALGIGDDHAKRCVLEAAPRVAPEGPRLIEADTRHLPPVTMSGGSPVSDDVTAIVEKGALSHKRTTSRPHNVHGRRRRLATLIAWEVDHGSL